MLDSSMRYSCTDNAPRASTPRNYFQRLFHGRIKPNAWLSRFRCLGDGRFFYVAHIVLSPRIVSAIFTFFTRTVPSNLIE